MSVSVFSQTWEQAINDGQGELDLYWYTSNPFIRSVNGQLSGAEYELMDAFKKFVREKHNIDLKLRWIEAPSFSGIMSEVGKSDKPNVFGVSAFSITDDRKEYLQFTDPYLPDITVLVTSEGTPIMRTYEEIRKMMGRMQAVTIKGTIYEDMLIDLEKQMAVDFDILYINSDENVLDFISSEPDRFGFIDLPIYLMWVQNGSELPRQNFFTVRGNGYGFIMPQHSDWAFPYNEFLADANYKPEVAQIISKYLSEELYNFIDNLYADDQLGTSILTKEKELQLANIQNTNLKLQEGKTIQTILIIGIVGSTVFMGIIGFLFFSNRKATKKLMEQKDRIEQQQADIRQKNVQLMNRNSQLVDVNEQKNDLLSILAHDLRNPLSNIIGWASIYHDATTTTDGTNPMESIQKEADQMSHLISKILSVKYLENPNVVQKEPVNLRELVDQIRERYMAVAAKKDIAFKYSDSLKVETVISDQLLLFMILDNLISNAIKFSPKGSLVHLFVESTDANLLIRVLDQGPGFTKEDKAKIFGRFQILSAKPTAGEASTGLGLSIVKKYVTDLGGEVWVESEEGSGSEFFVRIPY